MIVCLDTNEIEARLHWFRIRVDQTVRRIGIKYGAILDPLARAGWTPKPVTCPKCRHSFVPGEVG